MSTAEHAEPLDVPGIDVEHLARRLIAAITHSATPGPAAAVGWLWPILLRRLAHARPVTITDLAHDSGHSRAQVRSALAELSDTEFDEQGSVIGHGITLRPTPHEFTVDGHRLYTWCALDTLIFPAVLDRRAYVVSPAPGSGQPVRLSVDPIAGVTAAAPATAVVTVLLPEQGRGVRATFCNHVHFYPDPAAAQGWLSEHPSGAVLTITQAADLGRRLARHLLAKPRG